MHQIKEMTSRLVYDLTELLTELALDFKATVVWQLS